MTHVRVRVDVVDRGGDVEAAGAHGSGSVDGLLPARLEAALAEVADRLDRAGVPWVLAGGAARRLLGAHRDPRDLDLEVAGADADAAAAALGLALAPATGGGFTSRRGATTIGGVEVDLSAGLAVRGAGGALPPGSGDPRAGAEPRTLAGRTVWCAPPEEALVRALVAGDWARVAKIAAGGGPPPRLDYVSRRLAAAIAAR